MKTIKQVLMERDGMTANEADTEIESAREDLHNRLEDGEMPFDLCADWFGLEPDYIDELI
ncbi:hypothetical protein KAU11_00280 [Candidatus Babeliales bacterium]|nr:hypothetical protein [Candidatus Babeliales bacterium]